MIKMRARNLLCGLCLITLFQVHALSQEATVSFNRDIRPILSDRCFACHGPDAMTREAGLRFDIPDGDEGALGSAIQPGSIEKSEAWRRINSDDDDELMPPPDAHIKPLSNEEKQLLKKWIESGAEYTSFWAFEPVVKPATPAVNDITWSEQSIDLHVLKKLETLGLKPAEQADARQLIRRVTFDLIGLPPTREEIQKFLEEYSRAPKQAWENLVDGLLSRPEYGEHIARYWLDLVRFADTNGMHKDFYRNNFEYRDWVIRAFNQNLPYDDFVRFQLAGDLYDNPTEDQLIASGFNRLHLIIDRGTALPEESFTKNVIDRVTAVGTSFMGLTVHCAQCHDHKYDPITQKDFYSLYAFFNNIDAEPETPGRPKQGLQQPFVSFATQEQTQELNKLNALLSDLDREIASTKAKILNLEKAAKKDLEQSKSKEAENSSLKNDLINELKKFEKKRGDIKKTRDQVESGVRKAMVMRERKTVRPTFMLNRGQYDSPGQQVERDTPGFLFPMKKQSTVASRMDLAEWMVDAKNPLTSRVAANRIWQQFFGVGLVKTSEDIGAQGEVPSHPELLDHLAMSFIDSKWDVKALVKEIVMSKTYQQSSVSTPKRFKSDPDNRWLSRGSRFRLDAEMIRDQILSTSGLISDRMYGPSVKPPQPDGLWKAVTMTGQRFVADKGESIYRRSVYTFWKRAIPPPQLSILNAPNRDACIARRERTNTPSQALLLLNETEYLKAARNLAKSVLDQPAEQRMNTMWETVTSKLPDDKEKHAIQSLIDELIEKYRKNPKMADDLCNGIDIKSSEQKAQLAAWTVFGTVLYNLDITKTRE